MANELAYRQTWKDTPTTLPILADDIPHFCAWVNWHGFHKDHRGHDFAAYKTIDDRIMFGLPPQTPVRAVANGIVSEANSSPIDNEYSTVMILKHGEDIHSPVSLYGHVVPAPDIVGKKVGAGDVIGYLHMDPQRHFGTTVDLGRLVHLHLELKYRGIIDGQIDPTSILPVLTEYKVNNSGNRFFRVAGCEHVEPTVANFKDVAINGYRPVGWIDPIFRTLT